MLCKILTKRNRTSCRKIDSQKKQRRGIFLIYAEKAAHPCQITRKDKLDDTAKQALKRANKKKKEKKTSQRIVSKVIKTNNYTNTKIIQILFFFFSGCAVHTVHSYPPKMTKILQIQEWLSFTIILGRSFN